MTQAIIPWYVFHGAVAAQNLNALNFWLQRWRFMDGGVILSNANIPALEVPPEFINFMTETKAEKLGADH